MWERERRPNSIDVKALGLSQIGFNDDLIVLWVEDPKRTGSPTYSPLLKRMNERAREITYSCSGG